jgi:long-chain acyl-CoA synthetase
MLTHGSIIHQIRHISLDDSGKMNPQPSDVALSLLPCWHIFERSAELFLLGRGACLVYSNIRTFRSDLQVRSEDFA